MSTEVLGDMLVRYRADISDLTSKVKDIKSDMSSVTKSAEESGDKVSKSIKKEGEAAKETSGGFKQMLGSVLSMASGMAIFDVASKSVDFLKDQVLDVIHVTEAHELVAAQTNQVLKSTKDVSGMTATGLNDLADSFSKTTMFSHDTVQSGENLLLTFTNIGKGVFPQATQSILDVSQAMGQDLKSSAIQVGKALGDPLTGMTALQRIGVTFSQSEKDQIKTMMSHNDIIGAQKVILHELSTEFGGSATAAGKTFAGQLQLMKNNMEDLKIKIGTALLPILNKFLGWFLQNGMPVLNRFADWFSKDGVAGIQRFAGWIQSDFIPALQTIGKWIGQNIIPALLNFGSWFKQNGVPALQGFVQVIQTQVIPAIQWFVGPFISVLGEIKSHWKQIWDTLGPVVTGVFNIIKGDIQIAWSVIKGIFSVAMDIISGNWGKAWNDLKDMLHGVWDGITSVFKGGADEVIGILNGMINGLDSLGVDIGPVHIHPHIPTIPMLAGGGIVGPGMPFIAGEHGAELITAGNSGATVRPIVAGGRSGDTHIHIEVGGTEVMHYILNQADSHIKAKYGPYARVA